MGRGGGLGAMNEEIPLLTSLLPAMNDVLTFNHLLVDNNKRVNRF